MTSSPSWALQCAPQSHQIHLGAPGPPLPASAGEAPAMDPRPCRLFSQQAFPSLQLPSCLHCIRPWEDVWSGTSPLWNVWWPGNGLLSPGPYRAMQAGSSEPDSGACFQGQGYSSISLGMETSQTGGAMRGCDSSYTVLSICSPGLGHQDHSFLGINPLEGTIKLFFFPLCDCFWWGGCGFRFRLRLGLGSSSPSPCHLAADSCNL